MPLAGLPGWLYVVACGLLLLLQHVHGETIYMSRGDQGQSCPRSAKSEAELGDGRHQGGKRSWWRMTGDRMGLCAF